MTRLLFRSGKGPFTPVVAEATLSQDVFNSNSGNYLFQHSIWKSLLTPDTEIISNGTLSEREPPGPKDAARINEGFDHFVIPMANSFRPEFASRLTNLTKLVEDLTIPVTVVGVGAQAGVDLDAGELAEVEGTVRSFVAAVLERSASIGVRGAFTAQYLRDLGFPADSIDIIGCPSLFLHGADLAIDKSATGISADSRLALNLTPEVPGIGAFATQQAAAHPNLTYIGQDARDLRLLLWGVPFTDIDDLEAPIHMRHRLYQEDRMRLFLDQWTWFESLATYDFTYGTRFHGNVAALLARRPAMLLAHDSRTLELAEYHQMPHRVVHSFSEPIDAPTLYDEANFTAFNAELPRGFSRYKSFLERNGLQHVWEPGNANPAFADQLAATAFPPAVKTLCSKDMTEVAARLQWLREGQIFDSSMHKTAYKHPFPHPPRREPATRHRKAEQATKQKLADQAKNLDALRARLERMEHLERRTVAGLMRRIRHRVARPAPTQLKQRKALTQPKPQD